GQLLTVAYRFQLRSLTFRRSGSSHDRCSETLQISPLFVRTLHLLIFPQYANKIFLQGFLNRRTNVGRLSGEGFFSFSRPHNRWEICPSRPSASSWSASQPAKDLVRLGLRNVL